MQFVCLFDEIAMNVCFWSGEGVRDGGEELIVSFRDAKSLAVEPSPDGRRRTEMEDSISAPARATRHRIVLRGKGVVARSHLGEVQSDLKYRGTQSKSHPDTDLPTRSLQPPPS